MRKILTFILVAGAAFGAAWSAAYDDFVKASEYRRIGNREAALTAYTAAISAGDLAPAHLTDAYIARAGIYLEQGSCATALADLDAALKLHPKLSDGLRLHARASRCLDKKDVALADLDALVESAPVMASYATRAAYYWYEGEFEKAAADYGKSVALHTPRSFDWQPGAYNLAWYAVSAARAKTFSAADLALKAEAFDLDVWPGPVVSRFLGKASEADVYSAAAKAEKDAPRHRKCDTDFFLGEWKVAGGESGGGKALLETVVKDCPKSNAASAARTDLKRIP